MRYIQRHSETQVFLGVFEWVRKGRDFFMKRWLTALFALLIMIVSLPSVMALQGGGQTPHHLDITGVNPNDGRTAFVTVNVTDANGQSVTDMSIDDFALTGSWALGGATITDVQSVTDDNLPLAIVLVLDTSSSMAGTPLDLTKAAARSFIEALSPNDTVALVSFSTRPQILQDYTTDRALLLSRLDNLPFGGQTALYDAGALGVEVAARAPYPRRAVVLLSDGAEYGGASLQSRNAGRDAAALRGVPVYTIGLGYGTDRTYLNELAESSNAVFYESPAPEDLHKIYTDLAHLFRSQYVLTTRFDGALDGRIYPFILSAAAAPKVLDAATFRAPIPVPLVQVSPQLTAPLGGPTTFTIRARSDSAISAVTADFAGQTQTLTAPYRLTLDPFTLTPGDYTLTVTAVDAEGDMGVTALPINISPAQARLSLDIDLAGLGALSTPVTVNLAGETQSPAISAELHLDDATLGTGTGLPAQFVIDPITLEPGIHTVEFVVTEQSGTLTTLAQSVEIAALPPLVSVDGLADADVLDSSRTLTVNLGGQTTEGTVTLSADGAEVDFAAGVSPLTLEVNPLELFSTPGVHTLTLAVVNAYGQPATVEFPVTIPESIFPTSTPTATPTETPDFAATAAVLTQAAQATADQAAALVRATEGAAATTVAQSTLDAQATLDADATAAAQALLDAQSTLDAESTGTAVSAFADIALATAEALATNEMQVTIDAELAQLAAFTATAEANAQATLDADAANGQATADAQATADFLNSATEAAATSMARDAQSTRDAQAAVETQAAETAVLSTRNAVQAAALQSETETANAPTATLTDEPTIPPTATDEPTVTATDEPTVTATDEPTATLTPTLEPTPTPFDPTSTPISLTDVVADAAQAPQFTPALALIIGVGLLVLIVIALIILRRRNE